jgi:hypothetical protein
MIFEPRVRTRLDWDALSQQSNVGVKLYFVDEQSDYRGWWLPWYVARRADRIRQEVQEDEGGEALAVTDAGNLPPEKAATVKAFEAQMRLAPAKFDICVYKLPNGARLVVDGNHHLVAALRSGLGFGAQVFEISGPHDQTVLQDLRRSWDSQMAR